MSDLDRLIDRERIRGASRMIPEGTDAKSVSKEQIDAVAADVEIFRRNHSISRKEIAQVTGYSPGVISEFIAGKYKGNNGEVALDLESWLINEEQTRSRPATTQFVWTNIAMQIKSTASYALDKHKISLVYGRDTSGVGKTTSLKAIHQELGPRRSTLVTIDKVDANPTGLLKKICQSMRIDTAGSNKQRYDRLKDKLLGRSHLLIFDQIHNLRGAKDEKPLYILTDLFDATKAGQLWVGTADMVTYLQRQQKRHGDESLTQICRRVFPRIDLMECVRAGGGGDGNGDPLVSVQHIREMFARNKLKLTAAASRFLCELANQPDSGSVGLCVELVEYVTEIGGHLASIDVPVLKEAMKRGLTTASAEAVLSDVEETQTRLSKVG